MSKVLWKYPIRRFVLKLDGYECFLEYKEVGSRIWEMHHTFSPPQLKGRGAAARVAEAALAQASENLVKVIPSCSFVQKFIQQHPKYRILVEGSEEAQQPLTPSWYRRTAPPLGCSVTPMW